MNRTSRRRLLVATAVLAAVFVVGVVWVVQRQGAYYRQVHELSRGDDDGRRVKVGGRVLDGAVMRDDAGVHFVLQDLSGERATVEVDYAGQMPASFAPGVDVVVVGVYRAGDGVIAAEDLQTKCPSRYEGRGTTPTAAPTP